MLTREPAWVAALASLMDLRERRFWATTQDHRSAFRRRIYVRPNANYSYFAET